MLCLNLSGCLGIMEETTQELCDACDEVFDLCKVECRDCGEPLESIDKFVNHNKENHGKILGTEHKSGSKRPPLQSVQEENSTAKRPRRSRTSLKTPSITKKTTSCPSFKPEGEELPLELFERDKDDIDDSHDHEDTDDFDEEMIKKEDLVEVTDSGFKCIVCGKVFEKKKNLLQHQIQAHDLRKELGHFRCAYCNRDTDGVEELHLHLKELHQTALEYHVCKICDMFFCFTTSVQKHMAREHPDEAFKCELCDERSKSITQLKEHLATAHPGAKFGCNYCKREFSTLSMVKQHIFRTHLKLKNICDFCSYAFEDGETYKSHISASHPDHVESFTCKTCGKMFASVKDRRNHESAVHTVGAVECEECGKTYKSNLRLRRHVLYVHRKDDRPLYECEYCTYTSHDIHCMKGHVNATHLKSRPYVCETCGKACATRSSLKKHTDQVHLKVRSHECELCNKFFVTKQAVEKHMRVAHLGEKRIKCPTCYRRNYFSKEELNKHLEAGCDQKKRKSRAKASLM